MAQKDWEEVRQIIDTQSSGLLEKFLISEQVFLPNDFLSNPFNEDHSNFSASDLGKGKPGQWIPVYYLKDISEYFRDNQIVPVREVATRILTLTLKYKLLISNKDFYSTFRNLCQIQS